MMRWWKIMAACVLTPPLVLAAQETAEPGSEHEQHEQHATPPPAAAEGHAMATMHEHMRQMREQMARIHAASDPVERQRLMQEHMQSMQRHMDMMGGMQGHEPASAGRCAAGEVPALTR